MTEETLQVRVKKILYETPDIKSFELVAANGRPLQSYTPGAHIAFPVKLADGKADYRCFSLLDSQPELQPELQPQPDSYRIAVRISPDGDGGSVYMHTQVHEEEVFEIRPPKNHFPLDVTADDFLFIAGGIGITPILCMAHAAAALDKRFALHFVTRTPELMPFRSELVGSFGLDAHLYFDDANPRDGLDLHKLLREHKRSGLVYVCGPASLIDATCAIAQELGWPEERVRFERFTNPDLNNPSDTSIELVLARSNISFEVPAGVTLLDAMLERGIDVPYDCRVGECGTCVATIVEGEPLHHDYFLNRKQKEKGKEICTCVSRALTKRLVLDL